MGKAYLSLGSNQAPEHNLRLALSALRERFGQVLVSPIYRTAAIGFDGPAFLNAAAVIETELDVHALNAWLHALEDRQGRDRSGPRFGNRPLDIDIVLYDQLVLDGPGHLQVPRDELRHAFVLKPLADIAPALRDPLSGHTLATLWEAHPEYGRLMDIVPID